MRLNRYIFGINSQLNTVDKQLKTGSTINKASDDPVTFNFTARVKGYSEIYSKTNENVQNGITIVDTATDARIRKAFREFLPDTTKLIIAQRVNSLMDADKILVMDEGKVVGFGTHDELLISNEIYKEIYETQTKGGGDFDEKEVK